MSLFQSPKNRKHLVIVGNGGHASVCRDIALSQGYRICCSMVETDYVQPKDPFTTNIGTLAPLRDANRNECANFSSHLWFIAIGDADARLRISRSLRMLFKDASFPTLIANDAEVPQSTPVGEGSVIMGGARLSSTSVVEDFSIVNTAAIVEHHGVVGSYSHMAPGAIALGHSCIGNLCMVGANAVVGQAVKLPNESTLGSLSYLKASPERKGVFVGSPARRLP